MIKQSPVHFHRMKDMPSTHLLGTGTPMCAGCGGLETLHTLYDILGENTVFVNAAGCMTLLSVYPFTPFRGGWLYTAMASAPAGAQGVRDAVDILLQKKKLAADENVEVIVITGDGAAYGMGMSATSGAMDRDLDFIYLCYDNEGYGNTGQQYSAATPHAAITSTSKGSHGYPGYKKDLFSIWAAHNPAYVATVIAAEPLDLAKKIEKLQSMTGPRMLISLAPCPPGWDYDPQLRRRNWPTRGANRGLAVEGIYRRRGAPHQDSKAAQTRRGVPAIAGTFSSPVCAATRRCRHCRNPATHR